MSAWVRNLLLGVATLLVAGCATQAPPRAVESGADDPDGQVLVMVADPAPPHFRPGAGGGGYVDTGRRQRVLSVAKGLAHDYGASLRGDWPMPSLGVHCVIFEVPAGVSRDDLSRRLEADPRVSWVQVVQRFHVLGQEQEDPYFSLQAGTRPLNLRALHALTIGKRVRVAVIDTGVDATHPDLVGQVARSEDFVRGGPVPPEQHGTAVAGVIAARAGNGVGIVGVAPGARILALRACAPSDRGPQGGGGAECSTFALAKALQVAILDGAQVINLSLSGPRDRLLGALIDKATAEGAIVVASVDGQRADGGFPASHKGVIAVTNRKPDPAVRQVFVAPGDDILTTVPDGKWSYLSGSSFSAAHVAGVAAVLLEKAPRLRATEFAALLAGGAEGAGAIDVDPCRALNRINARIACLPNVPSATAIVTRTPKT